MFPASNRVSPLSADRASLDLTGGRAARLHTDALGERWLLSDSPGGALDILKFKKTFADAPEFEARLRRRVDEFRALRHPSIAPTHGVEWLDEGQALALVSVHTPGRRLSEVTAQARGPLFALEFIRQVTPAVFALQQVRPGAAHGTLTADRVVVAREGRLIVLDTPLGPAIESLRLPRVELREMIGIGVPETSEVPSLDQRLDVVQIGLVALSLLLGRRVDPADFRHNIAARLDEIKATGDSEVDALRRWLENALQLSERPFECALDALEALKPTSAGSVVPFRAPESPAPSPASSGPNVAPTEGTTGGSPIAPQDSAPASSPDRMPVRETRERPAAETTSQAPASARTPTESPKPLPKAAETGTPAPARRSVRLGVIHWAVILLAVVASVEAVAIAGLVTSRPMDPVVPSLTIAAPVIPASVSTPSASAPDESLAQTPTSATVAPSALESASPVPAAAPAVTAPEPLARAASSVSTPKPSGQVGGVKVQSPLECQVFENNALVGTTAGPIALAAGEHDLEFVHEGVGLRSRQRVSVKGGQLTNVTLTLPEGRVNVNAAPWASVWIDGTPAGDTPLANLELPVGSHEFLFKHPQLGEQRMVALVKADGLTRVSASFQR